MLVPSFGACGEARRQRIPARAEGGFGTLRSARHVENRPRQYHIEQARWLRLKASAPAALTSKKPSSAKQAYLLSAPLAVAVVGLRLWHRRRRRREGTARHRLQHCGEGKPIVCGKKPRANNYIRAGS